MPSSALLESSNDWASHVTPKACIANQLLFWAAFWVADYVFDKVTHDSCVAVRPVFCLVFGGATLLHLSAGSSLWPGSCLRGWWFEAHSWKRWPQLNCCSWSYPGSRTYWTEVFLCNMQRREKLHLEDKIFFMSNSQFLQSVWVGRSQVLAGGREMTRLLREPACIKPAQCIACRTRINKSCRPDVQIWLWQCPWSVCQASQDCRHLFLYRSCKGSAEEVDREPSATIHHQILAVKEARELDRNCMSRRLWF